MAKIEEEFSPDAVSYIDPVWRFLVENGHFGAWVLSLEIMQPVWGLVNQDPNNIDRFARVSQDSPLTHQYLNLILPLLVTRTSRERADFASGFMEAVVEWKLEDFPSA